MIAVSQVAFVFTERGLGTECFMYIHLIFTTATCVHHLHPISHVRKQAETWTASPKVIFLVYT